MGLFIDKDTTLSASIKCNYHRIVEFSFNSLTGRTLVTIYSYITKADAEAGKAPYSQASHELTTVNPLKLIEQAEVGTPLFLVVQSMLENSIVTDVPEYAEAVIG